MHRLVNYTGITDETRTMNYFQTMQESSPENAVAAERDGHRCVITNVKQFHHYRLLSYTKGHKVSSWQSSTTDMRNLFFWI